MEVQNEKSKQTNPGRWGRPGTLPAEHWNLEGSKNSESGWWQTNTRTNTAQYERHLSRSLTSTCQVTMGRTGAELSAGQALVASGIIGDWEQVCRDTPIFTGLLQCAVAPLRGWSASLSWRAHARQWRWLNTPFFTSLLLCAVAPLKGWSASLSWRAHARQWRWLNRNTFFKLYLWYYPQ